jgi:hypothetical protein
VHQLKRFCNQLHVEDRDTRDIAAGLGEARDEANFDRIGTDKKNDRNRLGRRLGSQRSWGAGADNNDGYLSANKIRSQCRQPIVVTLCPQVLDRYVAALDNPVLSKPL